MQCLRFIYKKSVQHQNSTNNIYQCNVFIYINAMFSFIRKAYNIIVKIVQMQFIRKADNIRIANNINQCDFVSFIRKA